MNQLFFLAMMMSSLSAPDLDLAKEQLSIDLQQAQTLVLTDPARCAQIATSFLERTANNPKQIISNRQEYGYREPMLNYGTATQTTGADLLKGECLQQLGQFTQAQESFEQGIAMAEKEQQFELQAHGLYLLVRSRNLQQHTHGAAAPLLDKLDKLLANPDLKESQLQVYSRLLRVNASVEERQFDLAKQQLAETRKWADHAKQPLARAWTSAVGGDLYQALGQPQLALGNTSKHNSKPNPCRIPSSSACSRTRWSASIRKSRSHKKRCNTPARRPTIFMPSAIPPC